MGAPDSGLDHERGVWADEHRKDPGAARRACWARLVDCNVACHHNCVPTVPRRALYPSERVQDGGGAPVARILGVDAFNVVLAVLVEEPHQSSLDSFRLVYHRLGANLEPPDSVVRDVIFFEQVLDGSQASRVDVFTLTADGHVFLAKADRVLACTQCREEEREEGGVSSGGYEHTFSSYFEMCKAIQSETQRDREREHDRDNGKEVVRDRPIKTKQQC